MANEHSIAFGGARASRRLGAESAITYLNDKAQPYAEPLARELKAPIFLPVDVQKSGQLEIVFEQLGRTWGRLDIALHATSFAPEGGPARRLSSAILNRCWAMRYST